MSEAGFVDAIDLEELPDKGFVTKQVGGLSVVLCQVKGEYFALENRCSHAFQTFEGGRLRGIRLMCPLHGASFDVRDGCALGLPATLPIRTFPVRIEGGRLQIQLED